MRGIEHVLDTIPFSVDVIWIEVLIKIIMVDDFEDDELDDITAVYDLGKGGLGENFNLSSPEMTEIIRLAFEEGIKEARRKHKEAGVPMVISRNGEIVYIQPDEIEV